MTRPLLACLCALAFTPAVALAGPDGLPPHMLREIERLVSTADALAIVTVGPAAANGERALKIERTLLGQLPASVSAPTKGIAAEDLQDGATLLLPFKRANDTFAPNPSRYELVSEGRIREYPLDVFLGAVEQELLRRSGMALAAKPAPKVRSVAKAAETPATATAPAP